MNADEIVKALRRMAPQFQAPGKEVINGATDLIESLQAEKETVYMDGIKKAIYEIMKEADIPGSNEIRNSGDTDDGMCAKVSERINAKLAASHRRERAAVELIAEVEKMINAGAEWFDAGAGEWGDAMERYRGEPGDERRFEMSMHIRDAYRIGIEKFDLAGAKIDRWRGPQEARKGDAE